MGHSCLLPRGQGDHRGRGGGLVQDAFRNKMDNAEDG